MKPLTVKCWRCGAHTQLTPEPVEIKGGLLHFVGRNQRRQFEMSAHPPQSWTPPQPPYQQVAASAQLQPGEAIWRTLDSNADVATPLRYAFVGAGHVIVILGSVVAWKQYSPWFALLTAGSLTSGFLYFYVTRRVLGLDDLFFRVRERDAEPTQQAAEPQTYAVEGKFGVGERKTIYTRFGVSDPDAFHRFCRAVAAGECNFSGRAASGFGLDGEWKDILLEFQERGLAEWDGKERTTPRLTRWGEQAVETFASTPPLLPAR